MPQIESAEDSEQRYADLFKKLDKGGDGRIDIKDLSGELASIGVCTSYAEVNNTPLLRKKVQTLGVGKDDFSQKLRTFTQETIVKNTQCEINVCF